MRSRAIFIATVLVLVGGLPAKAEVPTSLPSSYKSFRAVGTAMEPTIAVDDVLLADTGYFADHQPQVGDIVVYRSKSITNGPTVKRIVAVEAGTIQLKDGKLIVNGRIVREPYLKVQGALTTYSRAWGPIEMQAGCIIVLGDNRDQSQDSRVDGCSSAGDLIGLVKYAAPSSDLANLRELR